MRSLEIQVIENPDGIFIATCPNTGLRSEGSTEAEARENLLEILDARRSEKAIGGEAVYADPDLVPTE
jgi:hypothetical protein